jgi:hypothetical protein
MDATDFMDRLRPVNLQVEITIEDAVKSKTFYAGRVMFPVTEELTSKLTDDEVNFMVTRFCTTESVVRELTTTLVTHELSLKSIVEAIKQKHKRCLE